MALKTFSTYAFLCLSIIWPSFCTKENPKLFQDENPKLFQAEIIFVHGIYVMHLSIGSPPVDIYGSVDTGSDLVWTQCEPCPQSQCFRQEASLFDPKKSSTYNSISCFSFQCVIAGTNCSEGDCIYSLAYGRGLHGSFSSGNIATETLTFGSTSGKPLEMPKIIFGCGHNNSESPNTPSNQTGTIGLGPGSSSLISQMATSIAGKFSYCLPHEGSSTINFGGIVAGAGVASTPLIIRDHYYLTLEAISVGNQRLEFVSGGKYFIDAGNIFVDTGVQRTLLPLEYDSNLKLVMSNMIRAQPIEIKIGEPGLSDILCYNISSQPELPEVTIHFKGADVKLSPSNIFQNFSDDLMCSAFRGGDANTIYGNIMQINFLIGYDTEQRTVSFKSTHCANN